MHIHEVAAVYDYSAGSRPCLGVGCGLLTDQGYSVFALAKFCDDCVEGKMLWWAGG